MKPGLDETKPMKRFMHRLVIRKRRGVITRRSSMNINSSRTSVRWAAFT